MAATKVGYVFLSRLDELGMPETEEDTRSQVDLPVRLLRDSCMHQLVESIRVIFDFDVDLYLSSEGAIEMLGDTGRTLK